MKNRIIPVLLVLILLLAVAVNASASEFLPDQDQRGSLTFVMEFSDTPLTGGNVNVCKVADIVVGQDNTCQFQLIAALQDQNLELKDLKDPQLAENLLAAVKEKDLPILRAPIEDGKVVFEDMEMGLYLVWQDETDASEGFAPIQPFLISVPRLQDDVYVLDVLSEPKVPVETEPTEPTEPTLPPDEELPQTGQMNWPVPVMALFGAVLFVVGMILCVSRKRSEHEK